MYNEVSPSVPEQMDTEHNGAEKKKRVVKCDNILFTVFFFFLLRLCFMHEIFFRRRHTAKVASILQKMDIFFSSSVSFATRTAVCRWKLFHFRHHTWQHNKILCTWYWYVYGTRIHVWRMYIYTIYMMMFSGTRVLEVIMTRTFKIHWTHNGWLNKWVRRRR